MAGKSAGLGGTLYITLAVLGLLILIGVLLWMRHQPGMRHSPERGRGNPPPALQFISAGPERA
jgi:hypothetical protein